MWRSLPRRVAVAFSAAGFSGGAVLRRNLATKAPSLRIVQSHIHNPFFNLAFEERLLAGTVAAAQAQTQAAEAAAAAAPAVVAPPADHTLYLWSNAPCVIIGKHQNPHREVHLAALRESGVTLVRRHSGGGCVYQDRGNAIFTFISRDTPQNKEQHNRVLLAALKQLGIEANTSGRNDVETGGKKISGCAFKREKGWLLHHGTMLVDVDMGALPRLLSPSKAKLRAKGVESVAARVVNLRDLRPEIDTEKWDAALTQAFLREHRGPAAESDVPVPVEHVDGIEALLAADPALSRSYSQLSSWDWVHGHSPSFSHEHSRRFEGWGSVDLCFMVGRGGRIEHAVAYSDALVPAMVDRCNERLSALPGRPYSPDEVAQALLLAEQDCRTSIGEEAAGNVRELREWIVTQL